MAQPAVAAARRSTTSGQSTAAPVHPTQRDFHDSADSSQVIPVTRPLGHVPDGAELQALLRDVENFAFAVPLHPDEDPSGRLAFKATCEKIDKESFYRFPVTSILERLSGSTTDWKLDHGGLGDKGAVALSEALKVNDSVVSLSLVDNWLTLKGGEAIFVALGKSKAIRRVDVSDNRLGIANIDGHSIGAVIRTFLTKSTPIQELFLRGNRLSDRDAELICEGSIENNSLVVLDLEHNDIGPRGGEALGRMLAGNAELRELNVAFNQLRHFGTLALLQQGLLRNNTIRRFNISWNGVDDEGGVVLGQILVDNGALEEIDASNNRIGKKGAEAIANGLKTNEALKRLVLHDNPLGDAGCATIVSAMLTNETLQRLDIRSTDAGKLASEALKQALAAREAADARRKPEHRKNTEVLIPRNLFMPEAW